MRLRDEAQQPIRSAFLFFKLLLFLLVCARAVQTVVRNLSHSDSSMQRTGSRLPTSEQFTATSSQTLREEMDPRNTCRNQTNKRANRGRRCVFRASLFSRGGAEGGGVEAGGEGEGFDKIHGAI